jgi:hypothetical protein
MPLVSAHHLAFPATTPKGMHEHVGQISDFFAHPKIAGSTIRRGKEMDSIQIYQLNTTLV